MDAAKLRAWWAHRQGLDGRLQRKTPTVVLEETGWSRSVGGCGPYLTIFSRTGTSREGIDGDVAKVRIHELPSARGCTYVVPGSHFGLALKVGASFPDGEMNVAKKLGVTEKEVDKLCDAVLKAVTKEPLDPEGLKAVLGGVVRNLGEAGKKKGLTTTLPLALGRLQAVGEIRRIPTNGRLDQQRYRYTRWKESPAKTFDMSEEEAFAELARLYFSWIAPATVAEFAQFAGLGVNAAKRATESLGLVPLEAGSPRMMPPDLYTQYAAFNVPKNPEVVLTSGLDGLALHRRELASLIDPADAESPIWKALDASYHVGGPLRDLACHAIIDRGRVIGLWEFDPEAGEIVWATFGKPGKGVHEAVKITEEFVKHTLGDARSFSLDSPQSRVPRIKTLRAHRHR